MNTEGTPQGWMADPTSIQKRQSYGWTSGEPNPTLLLKMVYGQVDLHPTSCGIIRGPLETRWYVFAKAVHACGTLGNVREGATLSSETGNGEGKLLLFLGC